MNEDDREHNPGIAAPPPKVDRAALAGLAGSARRALDDLRPGGKVPPRRTLAGEAMCEISVRLKVVTPILGGGPKLRDVDRVDVIRVPTVRGHLRFWWRALYGHQYTTSQELYAAESALWGRPADNTGGRSELDVRVADVRLNGESRSHENIEAEYKAQRDWFEAQYRQLATHEQRIRELRNNNAPANEVHRAREQRDAAKDTLLNRHRQSRYFDLRDPRWVDVDGSYALWTAGATDNDKLAVRWRANVVTFDLTLLGPASECANLRNVVRAWILFGGYGSRTRRGLGSLTVDGDERERRKWLPNLFENPSAGDLSSHLTGALHFNRRIFDPVSGRMVRELPQLADARLYVDLGLAVDGETGTDAISAWTAAIRWLQHFRQDVDSGARRPGHGRPGRSNWPEADKIRRITGRWSEGHEPRDEYKDAPAFSRADFGLPIVGKFKDERQGDPRPFELRWRSLNGDHDRLASALILRALPLANGNFLPMALWMDRGRPAGSKVYLKGFPSTAAHPDREAEFDILMAAGDTSLLAHDVGAAVGKAATLRAAFLTFIAGRGVQRIAP
jgi:CRISPR-associated protein Cmr1